MQCPLTQDTAVPDMAPTKMTRRAPEPKHSRVRVKRSLQSMKMAFASLAAPLGFLGDSPRSIGTCWLAPARHADIVRHRRERGTKAIQRQQLRASAYADKLNIKATLREACLRREVVSTCLSFRPPRFASTASKRTVPSPRRAGALLDVGSVVRHPKPARRAPDQLLVAALVRPKHARTTGDAAQRKSRHLEDW
eukprot:6211466-Pleurochrysis_carterae.AAC.2